MDLSHACIGPNLLRQIVSLLKRAKSLLTLDVSGNTVGITDKVRKHLSKRIVCKLDPFDLERFNYINEYVNLLNKNVDRGEKKNEKILQSIIMRNLKQVTSTT